MKGIAIFLGIILIFLIHSVQAEQPGPVVRKAEELMRDYRSKKAQGYDMSEVEETLRLLKGAKEKGDKPQFLRLLRRLQMQLGEVNPPAAQPDSQVEKVVRKKSAQGGISLDEGPWPMYCHDPHHTCRSPYKGLTKRFAEPKWTFTSPGGQGISSPAAIGSDGNLYVGTWKDARFQEDKMEGHSGILCALSSNGRLRWLHNSFRGSLLASGVESSPLLTSDGRIIYGKDDGHVFALHSRGQLIWDFSCDDTFNPKAPYDDNEQVIPSPVLGPDGTLYICSHWGNVYNPAAMKELSKRIPEVKKFGIKPVKKPPWGKVYAINAQTGSRKWVYDPSLDAPFSKKVIWGSPAVGDDGTILFEAHDTNRGYLYALNPDGTKKWRFPKEGRERINPLHSSPSIGSDGTIYIGSFGFKNKARLYAVNPDGTLKWSYEIAENRITATPGIGPDGTIYVGSHNWGFLFSRTMSKKGHVYALEDLGHKAKLKWKFEVEYGIIAPLAIDNQGNVFFGTNSDPSIIGSLGPYNFYALNSKGQKVYSHAMKGRVHSPPVIDKDGTIYVGTTMIDAKLYAFGLQNK